MAEELKNKGNEAFQKGDYEGALKFFTQAIEIDPNNHVLYSNRSACYAKMEKGNESLQDANKTVELKPDWAKGWGRKGAAHHLLGQLEEAAEAYKKGLELDPQNTALRQGYQDVKVSKIPPANLQMFAQLFGGDVWSKIRNHPETKTFLDDPAYVEKIKEIQQDPSTIQKHISDQKIMATFGMLAQQAFRPPSETTSTTTSTTQQPQAEPMETERTETKVEEKTEEKKVEKKETPQAESMETESKTKPEKTENQIKAEEEKQKGNALYKAKKFEESLKHYDAAIELDPTNIIYYTNKAAVYFEQGKYEECISTCLRGIEEGRMVHCPFESIAKAFARIGNAYAKLDKLEEAIEAYNKSLSEHRTADTLKALKKVEKLKEERDYLAYIDPQKSIEAKERGNTLFKEGKYPEAVKEYTEAIKRNPKDPIPYSNRAACYTKLGAFPEGLKDCEEAIKLDPKFVKAYTRKAHLHFGMKEYQKAIQDYREGLKIDPNNTELQQGLERATFEIERMYQGKSQEERAKDALKDPEIQEIMGDPVMRQILEQMQSDPKAVQDHLRNPVVAERIQKLIDAGIIQVGRRF